MNAPLEASAQRRTTARHSLGFATVATLLLSIGVGAATAGFALIDGNATHARHVACETVLELPNSSFLYAGAGMPSSAKLRQHVTGVYEMSYDAVEETDWSWSDLTKDLDLRALAPLFAAGALALLVACARGAAYALTAPRLAVIATSSAIGAVLLAAMLIDALGLPGLGLRAIAFAMGVSMVAVTFARSMRRELPRAMR